MSTRKKRRGVVHEKKKTLSELYGAQKLGAFGIKNRQLKTGNLKQDQKISEQVTVANLGKKPLQVTWTNVSEELTLSVEPNPIPAGSTAKLTYTVSANPEKYGRWQYTATPVLNGQKADGALEITTWTQENFAFLDQATRDKGPIPYFTGSTVNLGTASKGAKLTAEFTCTNRGKKRKRPLYAGHFLAGNRGKCNYGESYHQFPAAAAGKPLCGRYITVNYSAGTASAKTNCVSFPRASVTFTWK